MSSAPTSPPASAGPSTGERTVVTVERPARGRGSGPLDAGPHGGGDRGLAALVAVRRADPAAASGPGRCPTRTVPVWGTVRLDRLLREIRERR